VKSNSEQERAGDQRPLAFSLIRPYAKAAIQRRENLTRSARRTAHFKLEDAKSPADRGFRGAQRKSKLLERGADQARVGAPKKESAPGGKADLDSNRPDALARIGAIA